MHVYERLNVHVNVRFEFEHVRVCARTHAHPCVHECIQQVGGVQLCLFWFVHVHDDAGLGTAVDRHGIGLVGHLHDCTRFLADAPITDRSGALRRPFPLPSPTPIHPLYIPHFCVGGVGG